MKTVVVLSGGLDSAVLLYHHLVRLNDTVRALTVDYGQRHRKEIEFARDLCGNLGVPHTVAELSSLSSLLPGSSQTDAEVPVPHGHYAADNMKATVVPNRNMILLSVAIGHAAAHGMQAISFAAHAGDHTIYPDCRPEFVDALAKAATICHFTPVYLLSPFVRRTKADIVKLGHSLCVPFDHTWSCYEGGEYHCGKCGTCVERKEAFQLAGVKDPTTYRT